MKKYHTHLIILAFYTFLSLLFTWPLVEQINSHIPGEATWAFDESTFIWNMWWLKHSLLNLQQTPLVSNYTFYPLGINLTTYTFNLFNAALGLPLQLAFSLPLANNLTLLFSYISSAYGMFLLSFYLLHSSNPKSPLMNYKLLNTYPQAPLSQSPNLSSTIPYLAAFTAGAVYAFSASRMMYVALGHYNFVTIQWFPFYTLFLLKTFKHRNGKNILLTALFATFCLYAELTYSVFLLFMTLILALAEWLKQRKQNKHSPIKKKQAFLPNLFISLNLIGLLTFLFTAPFILAVLPDFLDPAYNEPGWGEGLKLSADLVGLVTLTPLHPLSGLDWSTELRAVIEGTSRFSDANTLFLGYGILALALIGFITYRQVAKVWFWLVITFIILSLGPLLTINGQNRFNLDGIEVTFPLPFALLHYLPILSANRVPNRFGIPLTMALAVLVAYGLTWLLTKINKGLTGLTGLTQLTSSKPHPKPYAWPLFIILFIFILPILLFDQYSSPIPLTDARIPDVYTQIGAEADNFAIMQLPLGWRNSYGTLGAERTQLQYYQTAFQKPMLGGNTSRNPQFKFDYYAQIPLFQALTETELYRSVDEATLERASQQASELMTLYNIKYLVVHQPLPDRKPYEDTYMATRILALELIPHQAEPIYQSPGVEVFAVEHINLPNPLIIDFGTPASRPYRGQGWANNEEIFAATANWASASQADIYFPLQVKADQQLILDIAPFNYPHAPPQRVKIFLNGHLQDDIPLLSEGWQQIQLNLSQETLLKGLNTLSLHFAETAQPRAVLAANRTIGNTGLETPIDLEVNSGFDFAFITVGFEDSALDASAHRRGVNIAVVDTLSGEVLEVKGFDTAANEFEAAALKEFINTIPNGQIVIIATQGAEASAFFNHDTSMALQSLGLPAQIPAPPFSAIGLKGAATNTATLASGEGTAYIRLGAIPDSRNLAAALDKVTIIGEAGKTH